MHLGKLIQYTIHAVSFTSIIMQHYSCDDISNRNIEETIGILCMK